MRLALVAITIKRVGTIRLEAIGRRLAALSLQSKLLSFCWREGTGHDSAVEVGERLRVDDVDPTTHYDSAEWRRQTAHCRDVTARPA
jgi:hypothetical protein